MTSARQQIGAHGEKRARRWYEREGYEIVARNWRCSDGEIDIVVRRGNTLIFSEVKTRRNASFGHPAEAVTPAKQARLRKLAVRFCRDENEHATLLRFDVVAICGNDLQVIENAF